MPKSNPVRFFLHQSLIKGNLLYIPLIIGLPISALKKAIESVTDKIKFPIVEKPLATITHILFDMDLSLIHI